MASAPSLDATDGAFERFLEDQGHDPTEEWGRDHNKKQCPECGGLHELAATACSVCGWQPIS